jgi:hypothetical protein
MLSETDTNRDTNKRDSADDDIRKKAEVSSTFTHTRMHQVWEGVPKRCLRRSLNAEC